MIKSIFTVVVGLILIAITYAWWQAFQPGFVLSVTTFEECKNAGFPVLVGTPTRCITSDGRTFVRPSDVPGTMPRN